jgi:hypothetical protein
MVRTTSTSDCLLRPRESDALLPSRLDVCSAAAHCIVRVAFIVLLVRFFALLVHAFFALLVLA